MRIQDILEKLDGVQEKGNGKFQACCPAHEDNKASLSVKESDGKVLLFCHAGCDYKAILDALGLSGGLDRNGFATRFDDALSGFEIVEKPNALKALRSHLIDRTPEKKPKRRLDYHNPVEAYDYRDAEGKLVYQAVRLQVIGDPSDSKNFLQRKPKTGGGWDYKLGDTKRVVYRLPEVVKAESDLLLIAEGEKDVNNLFNLGFVATCNVGGAGKWLSEYSLPLAKRDIVIFQDNDEAGVKHSEQVADSFNGLANSIRVVTFDNMPPKSDISDWLAMGKSADDLKALIDSAETWVPTAAESPYIKYERDEAKTNDEIIRALGQLGADDEGSRVYSRGGALVGLCEIEDPELPKGTFKIQMLSEAVLRERITQCCTLFSPTKKPDGEWGQKLIRPSQSTVRQIKDRGNYRGMIRPLTGIVQAPTIRKDGSILQTKGYDKATGLIYKPLVEFDEVPEQPTAAQVKKAFEDLRHVVVDFPLVSEADEAAWIALVLTLISRQCVNGCVPIFAITANTRGAGKSLLADAGSLIAYGRPAARRTFPNRDDELRKVITTVAVEATSCVLFDNMTTRLQGGGLDAAVTSETWQDRILGSTKSTPEMPLKTVWIATGNNLSFGTDIARRVISIRLDTPEENPEERTGFQHDNLIEYVRANRPRLAVAALTILRAYFVAGSPRQPDGQFGSFESWSDTIRGAVVWSGLADPLETREYAKESDDTADLHGLLIAGLLEADSGGGLTAKQIEETVKLKDEDDSEQLRYPVLAEAFALGCGDKLTTKSIAGLLRQFKGKTIKNTRIIAKSGRSNLKFWSVEKAELVSLISLSSSKTSLSHMNLEASFNGIRTTGGRNLTNQSNQTNQIENSNGKGSERSKPPTESALLKAAREARERVEAESKKAGGGK